MTIARSTLSEAEYLEFERNSDVKHEFYNGEVVAMAGAGPAHNTVAMNIGTALKNALKGRRCLVWASDARVKAERSKSYFYPDVSVVCDRPQLTSDNPPSLLNPVLVVEVLSRTTEQRDRGPKFAHLRGTPSVMTYVLVSPSERRVEVFTRKEALRWDYVETSGMTGAVAFAHPACEISLADIFADLDLLPPDEETAGSSDG